MKVANGKTWSAAFAAAAVLLASACAASPSSGADAAPRPGSFQAIMAVKSPAVYGPHLPAADRAPSELAPVAVPGSALTILAAKSPGLYGPHLPAADVPPTVTVASTCQPGSFAAVMSAKLPPSARPGNAELYQGCR